MLCVVVAGVPLDDNCEWGESYWCSDLKVARKCGALDHCTSTVWSKQILAQVGFDYNGYSICFRRGGLVNDSWCCSQANDSGIIATSHIVARDIQNYCQVFVKS